MTSSFKIKIPAGINPDLQDERQNASFSVSKLTEKLHGGSEKLSKKREIESIMLREPGFKGCQFKMHNSSRMELYEGSVQRGLKFAELVKRYNWGREEADMAYDLAGEPAFGIQGLMVIPTIERLGTDDQRKKWLPLCRNLKVIGNYGQTELGHGTNLRKLQTTATYDASTEEFVMNTPVPSGIKFWPGGLGKISNLSIVMAQLIIEGRPCGLQVFLVPIRDFETHEPLPGVYVGDIGPKIGINANDNGYLVLDHVRIPRENMLMRYTKVTREGRLQQAESGHATYSTMVYVRVVIAGWSYSAMSKVATIAVRYSAVRRQSELEPGAEEPKVLDFQTQQYKLFPAIALAYSCWFAAEDVKRTYDRLYRTEVDKGNFGNVAEVHALSCALKAFTTDLTTEAMETCRRACGGHGFLLSAGIAPKCLGHALSVTVEGENTVLYQQVARYLLKSYEAAQRGKQLPYTVAFLRMEPGACCISSEDDCRDLGQLSLAFRQVSFKAVQSVAESMQNSVASGQLAHLAWNSHQVQLVEAAKAYADLFLVATFVKHIGRGKDDGIRTILTRLCQLHCLHRIHVNSGKFIQAGALTVEQAQFAEHQLYKLLAVIRPDAVPLVDAFGHCDDVLSSAIGAYDGHAYERLLLAAQDSALNQAEVLPSFHKYIKPFQKKHQSRL